MTHSISEDLAREILMVDSEGKSLIPGYEAILERGLSTPLPSDAERRDVLIIGAGIAGLLSASLLKKAGYTVTILEANVQRLGGRIKTFHSSCDAKSPFRDPLQYAEAGAMRLPKVHPLVQKLLKIQKLDSKARPFYNIDVSKENDRTKTFRTWLATNGLIVRRQQYLNRDKALSKEELSLGFPLDGNNQDLTASELLDNALKEPKSWVDSSLAIEERVQGWIRVIDAYGELTMRQYLSKVAGYSDTVINYIGTFENLSSRLYLSFIQSFIETTYINADAEFVELDGGSWQLPYSFYDELKNDIVFNSRVTELQWCDPITGKQSPNAIHKGRKGVYVRTTNQTHHKDGGQSGQGCSPVVFEQEFTADFVICTIPFSCLRFVDVQPVFSYTKHRAIIELHYDSATKVLLEFSERFWEWDEDTWNQRVSGEYRGHNSLGGGSISDTTNRFTYFPSHPVKGSTGGVILASYTWSDDASRWDAVPEAERYQYALRNLAKIYGKGIYKFFTGIGKTESWMDDPYAFGEAAIFAPGQLKELHPYIPLPEGNIHFAGDHTSLKHAWIEGSLESAIRTVQEIHEKACSKKKEGTRPEDKLVSV